MIRYFYFLIFGIIGFHTNGLSQDYLESINNVKDFQLLSGLPLTMKYGQVDAIKIVYDIKNNKLYYINSGSYTYHFDFCKEYLNNPLELYLFNKYNYSNSKNKQYLLANINHFKSQNMYVIDLAASDIMNIDDISFLYEKIVSSTFFGSDIYFLLNTTRLLNVKDQFKKTIRVITPSEIFQDLTYQPIGKYDGQGILKIIGNPDTASMSITKNDIIVISQISDYIPEVAGVIITAFQTPLSHLSILAQNRHFPVMAYKNALKDPYIQNLNLYPVSLNVTSDTFILRKTDHIERVTGENKRIKLKKNFDIDSIIDMQYLNRRSSEFVGNKAANFSILYKLGLKNNFKTPEHAFAIPFYFYEQHIKSSQADKLIDELLSSPYQTLLTDSLKTWLDRIQYVIMNAKIDSVFIENIKKKISGSGYDSYRFRSSTNAEDTEGFSGAGLYTSKTGIYNHPVKTFEKAIKQVWASLWSFSAFMEREYFSIDHRDVSMGILVHRSFPNETINGVAITKNLYRPGYYGFVVNAQSGNYSVVNPDSGMVCDQFICYPTEGNNVYEDKVIIDVLTMSNLSNGHLLMSEKEIVNLANKLEVVKKYFSSHVYPGKSFTDLGLDIEFKLDGEHRDLYLKQVRLYNE